MFTSTSCIPTTPTNYNPFIATIGEHAQYIASVFRGANTSATELFNRSNSPKFAAIAKESALIGTAALMALGASGIGGVFLGCSLGCITLIPFRKISSEFDNQTVPVKILALGILGVQLACANSKAAFINGSNEVSKIYTQFKNKVTVETVKECYQKNYLFIKDLAVISAISSATLAVTAAPCALISSCFSLPVVLVATGLTKLIATFANEKIKQIHAPTPRDLASYVFWGSLYIKIVQYVTSQKSFIHAAAWTGLSAPVCLAICYSINNQDKLNDLFTNGYNDFRMQIISTQNLETSFSLEPESLYTLFCNTIDQYI